MGNSNMEALNFYKNKKERFDLEEKVIRVEEQTIDLTANEIYIPFSAVEVPPIFPGCEDAADKKTCFQEKMFKHISKNFRYPLEAQEKGIQGKVNLMFTIAADGSIQNIRKRGPSESLEAEGERIIAKLPKMTPGKQKGKAVNVPYSIPITFKLQ
jgi:protein TonB